MGLCHASCWQKPWRRYRSTMPTAPWCRQIDKCKRCSFAFGALLSQIFDIYITTKLHWLMHHVDHHLLSMGYLRHDSWEENEMLHKELKYLYNNTNKHVNSIVPQLLTIFVQKSPAPDETVNVHCDTGSSVDDNGTITTTIEHWAISSCHVINLVVHLSGHQSPTFI